METYLCKFCGNDVPNINQVIHSIQCQRNAQQIRLNSLNESSKLVDRTFNGDQQSTPPSSWLCSKCTFANDFDRDICEICCSYKIITGATVDSELTSSAGSMRPQGGWSCPSCTFENEVGNNDCSMCQSIRPPFPTIKETLLLPDDLVNFHLWRSPIEALLEEGLALILPYFLFYY